MQGSGDQTCISGITPILFLPKDVSIPSQKSEIKTCSHGKTVGGQLTGVLISISLTTRGIRKPVKSHLQVAPSIPPEHH